ncbi:crotonobetainyl-CoA:carnitine CoA-transferase CaiB-like acyl-CoA transferase [Maritalea mobilis]|uniref:Crotonobetainyl-CoA:carnitine CoA-transferase CaiB-like acyl-CoA transferase n=1 Tax=Maritalea mobilis TaxID=483324 RepID=A0A4R6VQ86_9HYPH|nr:CaiB/BaiF CoA-transferase family protein [Maritalea mobilis]TDQ64423.1 crotonobetainyl-CoA:carnitine CoA-transferase CaiB-like acyl-CoA transferase [Maritalea mobilis]
MTPTIDTRDKGMLDGLLVVDFSQFLAGPLAGLKLADMGARVIKVERPEVGDLCRYLYLTDVEVHGANTLFHAINRNKQSYSANLKDAEDLERVKALCAKADVIIQNFRPGIMKKLGLDYDQVKAINPKVVYASISGYGEEGDWQNLPGQDLLAQARSGLLWLSGNAEDTPTAMGLAVADQLAGNIAVQGILAGLINSARNGQGVHVQTSLLEALVDFQFEVLTTHLNDEKKRLPQRSEVNNAHAYLSAPYGVYQTKDGFIAIAMTPVDKLGAFISCDALLAFDNEKQWFEQRDEIKTILADHLKTQTTSYWMEIFVAHDVWASEVLDWPQLFKSTSFKNLDFFQDLDLGEGHSMKAIRSPIRINGDVLKSSRPAPSIGEHNAEINREFNLMEV